MPKNNLFVPFINGQNQGQKPSELLAAANEKIHTYNSTNPTEPLKLLNTKTLQSCCQKMVYGVALIGLDNVKKYADILRRCNSKLSKPIALNAKQIYPALNYGGAIEPEPKTKTAIVAEPAPETTAERKKPSRKPKTTVEPETTA